MSTVPQAEIAARVAKGMEWLDRNEPGWIEKIDTSTLDLRYPFECVCGQIDSEGFYHFAYHYDLSQERACNLGLSAEKGANWAPLTRAWRRAIKQRLRLDRA